MLSSLLSLSSFNELLALSVGLNLAYVLVNKSHLKKENYSLFSFLDSFARQLAQKAFNDKTVEQQRLRSMVARIQYYLTTGLLSEKSAIILTHISDIAQENLNEIDSTEKEIQNRFSEANCINTVYMPYLAFDCAVYGVVLLLLAALESHLNHPFYLFISVFNIGIVLLALFCVYHENKKRKKGHSPTVLNQVLFLIVICTLGLFIPEKWEILSSVFWANLTLLLAVFLSMSSLVAYFLNCSVKCLKEFFESKRILRKSSILSGVIIHEKDIERFQDEFNSIDEKLGRPDFNLYVESTTETS